MQVKIGPLAYAVETIEDLKSKEGVGLFGEIDYGPQVIRLEKEMTPARSQVALWHEILHAVDNGYQLDLGEQKVGTLAMIIVQLMADNPALLFRGEEG